MKNSLLRPRSVLIVCLTILIAGYIVGAGDLNPPAGPVAPTHKTLTEVEPRIAINAINTLGDDDSRFKITQPGSYYLTGNITGVMGKHGIEIVASGVTVDLKGFELAGVAAMGAFDGVSVTAAGLTNIAVVNGSVRSWGDEGVDLKTEEATNCRVADLLASGNTGHGIFAGIGSTVSNCSASQNGGNGIQADDGSTVSNCSAYQNSGGIGTGGGSTVSNCSAYLNSGAGIFISGGCTVSNCSVSDNTGVGIGTSYNCIVTGCMASDNGGGGISTQLHCTVLNCVTFSNTGTGIVTDDACTVSSCSAGQNSGAGISVNSGCTVVDCAARLNTLDGIACDSGCVVRGNTCSINGQGDGAGIHATGSDNRIEANNCTSADRGIDVDLAGNFISRNICSGNTTNNWDIVAGNVCLVVQGVTGAAILGNTGGAAPGSTDPNANFSY